MSSVPKLTKEQAFIITAFTGVTTTNFGDFQEYAEKLLGRPLFTHHFADPEIFGQLRKASRQAFIDLCPLD